MPKEHKFDTKAQYIKYKVLREVATLAWQGQLERGILDVPKTVISKDVPSTRCCIYKERAIVAERVKLAMGGDKQNPNPIEVIDIACDECPMSGYEVTNFCRGCLSHPCKYVCPKDAIFFDHNHVAHIDKEKCVDCGACAKVCPYSAIINRRRPCENACKINAISMNVNSKAACIDNNKCISCGACVYQCPFGAIQDKSYILDVIDIIKNSDNNKNYKVFAVVAPSISSQFVYADLPQVITGLKELGFFTVIEAALGADMVAQSESLELSQKGSLISSCCPAFVTYIYKNHPSLIPFVSGSLSPMATISKYIKENEAPCKVVFIGPCTAKKGEVQLEKVKPYVDAAITFEELQALFDSRDIDITSLEQGELDNASYFGRIFARCGGLSDAVAQGLKENGIEDFQLKSFSCDGIEQCKTALLKKSKNLLDANFIEGMACVGGCIGGAGCLTHNNIKNKKQTDQYGKQAQAKTIADAISSFKKD